MNHIKLFEEFNKEPAAVIKLKEFFDYYAYPEKTPQEKSKIQAHAEKLYAKIKHDAHLVVDEFNNDGSPMIVYHTTASKFTRFKTPAFFASRDGAYSGDYDYACVISVKNMLDLRAMSYKKRDEWFELIRSIFAGSDLDTDEVMAFAEKYEDSYGFFKLVDGGFMKPYRWDIVFDYMKKNNYDGAILRESDQSITSYFDGYIIMEPTQIQILAIQKNEED